ncbi:MAG: TIGR02302 family protein [Acetobacteraceae bacterium]|nr:TIGR02302 family protein [Acetobacteraceae bacterium]
MRLRLALARLALWWEAIWPALWPPLGLAGMFLAAALLGLPQLLPGAAHAALLAAVALLLAFALWRGFRRLPRPGRAEAARRLERDSGLRHRPISAIEDRPATADPVALALWRAHQARAAAQLAQLRLAPPSPGLPRRDRRALRAAVVLSVVSGLVIAGPEAPERVARALSPAFAVALPQAPPLRVEAWVTPPAYTGAAPLFLPPEGGSATVPAGSRLTLALSGGIGGEPALHGAPAGAGFRPLGPGAYGAEVLLDADRTLSVRRSGAELLRWEIAIRPDLPPTAAFTADPERAPRGLTLRLPWRAQDDWGVVSLRAELRLQPRPGAPPLAVEITLPSAAPREARGTAQPDLSAHPWAGLPVEVTLVARDGAGQEGRSATLRVTLPEREFRHPVAQALVALRRQMSVAPEDRATPRAELDRISSDPAAFEDDLRTFLVLRAARARIARDQRPEAVEEVQQMLWETALALEEGRDARTARALAEAREALREALAEAERTPPDAEARAELERRIQELREAIRRHLEALAERLRQENAESLPFDPANRLMDQRDLNRRTERMREAARQGRIEEAQREMAELERMLDALEEGRVARAEPRERRERRERGQQQMGAVGDIVRRQAELLDRAHQRAEAEERRRAEERRAPPQARLPNSPMAQRHEQEREAARAEAERDAARQRALRRALGEVMQQFGDLTGEIPDPLGRADQAMRAAQEALGQGRDSREAQARAIRELTEGARQMAQALRRQMGDQQGEPGEEDGEGEGMGLAEGGEQGGEGQDQMQALGQGRDPLGRRTREQAGGAETGGDVRVPDEAERLRSRELQQEIRRRASERQRPKPELDYLERLLPRF